MQVKIVMLGLIYSAENNQTIKQLDGKIIAKMVNTLTTAQTFSVLISWPPYDILEVRQ